MPYTMTLNFMPGPLDATLGARYGQDMSSPELGLDRRLREQLDQAGQEFLAEILGRETSRNPDNIHALADLAMVLTRLGRHEDGLAVDLRLVNLEPENPAVHYNLACSLALLDRKDDALDALEAAIEQGYDDLEHLLADDDLACLREESRYDFLAQALSAG
jgi:Flp pilus assembly protein TadD